MIIQPNPTQSNPIQKSSIFPMLVYFSTVSFVYLVGLVGLVDWYSGILHNFGWIGAGLGLDWFRIMIGKMKNDIYSR